MWVAAQGCSLWDGDAQPLVLLCASQFRSSLLKVNFLSMNKIHPWQLNRWTFQQSQGHLHPHQPDMGIRLDRYMFLHVFISSLSILWRAGDNSSFDGDAFLVQWRRQAFMGHGLLKITTKTISKYRKNHVKDFWERFFLLCFVFFFFLISSVT